MQPCHNLLTTGISAGSVHDLEDFKRYRADKEVNARLVEVYDPAVNAFVKKRWEDVKVSCPLLCQLTVSLVKKRIGSKSLHTVDPEGIKRGGRDWTSCIG